MKMVVNLSGDDEIGEGVVKLEETKGREEVGVLMLVMVERFWGSR